MGAFSAEWLEAYKARTDATDDLRDAIIKQTDMMDELRRSLDVAVDEIRGVQTYGLRLNK